MSETEKTTGLALLRVPFPAHQISKLPKPTKAQTDEVKSDYKKGIRCEICGAWHHPKVVHLDYVGHAALTDRLLDADPNWTWEPVAFGPDGQPAVDKDGGMWIKLTVCGVTRYGYGDSQDKTGPNAVKERIGDALRNAAMRFGAALDLWHKGDLHAEEESSEVPPKQPEDEGKAVASRIAAANVTPTAGAKDRVTPEQRATVDLVAERVKEWLRQNSPDDAVAILDEADFDADEKVYFWTKFDSKDRSAMKKAHERRIEEAKQKELA